MAPRFSAVGTSLVLVALVVAVVTHPNAAPADASRPAPSFSHVRFFNGTGTTTPASVTYSPTRDPNPPLPPTSLTLGNKQPKGVYWADPSGGWTDVTAVEMVVTLSGGATITITTPSLSTGSYIVEMDVILSDDGSDVSATGKCLYKSAASPYWTWGDTASTAKVPHTNDPVGSYTALFSDVALFNNSSAPLAVGTTTESYYSTSTGLVSLFATTPVPPGGALGVPASHVPTYSDVTMALATAVGASPNKALSAGANEHIFLAWLFATGTAGSLQITPYGIVQSSTAPYWAFK